MMGSKKLSAIRAEVHEAFVRAGIDPVTWLEQEIQRVERQAAGPTAVETLQLLRDALAREAKQRPRTRKRRASVR